MPSENNTYCVEFGAGPVYLEFETKHGADGTHDSDDRVNSVFKGTKLYYLSAFKKALSFAGNIDRHYQLKRILLNFARKFPLHNGIAHDSGEFFEQGYFLDLEFADSGLIADIRDAAKKNGLVGDSPIFSISCQDNELIAKIFSVENIHECLVTSKLNEVAPPPVHPAFISQETNSVYHDIERCYEVLDQFDSLDEVRELRKICDGYIQKYGCMAPLTAKNRVVVIEGLDATGKSTLTTALGVKLNATVLKSPPECICHLRPKFDSHPQLLRRAFYSLGNYAFAAMIKEAADKGVVIADRFWNSTAAYAIATDVNVGGAECLPPNGHWVYNWPKDLLKPDAVFLLTITDEERRRRLMNRGTIKTDEEIRLESSSPFRQRLVAAYERMDLPKLQKIDASGTKTEVLDKTIEILNEKKLL